MSQFWISQSLLNMFQLSDTVYVAEKIVRPILVYVFLVVLLRVFGKRELAQLNPFDLVVLLSLANTVQNAIIGDDTSLIGGMIGAFTLCACNYMVVRFMFKHRRLDQLIAGTPTVLIEDGQMNHKGMAKEMLNEIDLTTMAHRQGFGNLDEVESCILEPGGAFFIQGKKPRGPERRHHDLTERIEGLSRQVEELKSLIVGLSAAREI